MGGAKEKLLPRGRGRRKSCWGEKEKLQGAKEKLFRGAQEKLFAGGAKMKLFGGDRKADPKGEAQEKLFGGENKRQPYTRHPWPPAPTANWSMMMCSHLGVPLLQHGQAIRPGCPIRCWSGSFGCTKPQTTHAHRKTGDVPSHLLLPVVPRKASHHGFECSPHAFTMGIGIRLRLTGKNGLEEVVASRTGALEQDLPCALCVWHPRDCLPQSSLLLQPRLGNASNELVGTDGSAQNLNLLRIPHIGPKVFEVRWTCSCPVPRPGFADMQLDSHDCQLLAQQIVHLANPL